MLGCGFLGQEQTGGLYNVVRADGVPLQIRRVSFCSYAHGLAVDDQVAVLYRDVACESAVY